MITATFWGILLGLQKPEGYRSGRGGDPDYWSKETFQITRHPVSLGERGCEV